MLSRFLLLTPTFISKQAIKKIMELYLNFVNILPIVFIAFYCCELTQTCGILADLVKPPCRMHFEEERRLEKAEEKRHYEEEQRGNEQVRD